MKLQELLDNMNRATSLAMATSLEQKVELSESMDNGYQSSLEEIKSIYNSFISDDSKLTQSIGHIQLARAYQIKVLPENNNYSVDRVIKEHYLKAAKLLCEIINIPEDAESLLAASIWLETINYFMLGNKPQFKPETLKQIRNDLIELHDDEFKPLHAQLHTILGFISMDKGNTEQFIEHMEFAAKNGDLGAALHVCRSLAGDGVKLTKSIADRLKTILNPFAGKNFACVELLQFEMDKFLSTLAKPSTIGIYSSANIYLSNKLSLEEEQQKQNTL